MKKLILTVLSFIALGAYNHAMAQESLAEKNPDFKDAGKYTGDKKSGKMHGQGVYEWKNGDRFEGNFVEGQIEGYGRYSWTDGDIY
ncbi:MAG: phosphatidylinositol-4-phosphate 5-kinase, partial [Bacteroidaceae bacterium]|nr:phosphatidylinositol-4-phosphate 5-kinase [Bacteroidaceae bacterium]